MSAKCERVLARVGAQLFALCRGARVVVACTNDGYLRDAYS
jgi:hypothetical protein